MNVHMKVCMGLHKSLENYTSPVDAPMEHVQYQV